MKKLICILLVFILPQIIFANQRYHFSNLSVQNGLSQLHVTCIYQDRLGYMWFGTRNGLNKFNGNNFETFWNHADDECSISNNTIACITEDAEGNLWFGTENGLNKLDKRRNGFKRYYFDPEANAANNKIISLFTDKEGTLWVGTISGLYVFDAKEDILKEIPLKELANNSISTIIEKDDLLYIASSMSGLVIYDPRKNRVVRSYRKDSKTLPIPSNYIKDVYIDKKDNIWIGTYKDGVCVIRHDLSEVIYYNTANGLSNNDIRCIKESPAGEMWIGTFDGLNIVNPVTSRIASYKHGAQGSLSHHSVYSILFDRMQTIWIGTYAGGVDYYNPYGHLFDFYNPATILNANLGILGPAVEYDGTLYISSEGGGLIAFDLAQQSFRQYTLPHKADGSVKNIFKTVYLDGDRILCGTSQGEVYEFNLNTRQFSLFYQTTDRRPIYHISRSRAGEVIIGAISVTEGLVFISDDGQRSIQTEFPVKGKGGVHFSHVICACEVDNDIFLIGTKNNGLFCYDKINHTLLSYNETNGLAAQYISSILKDHSGRIWISSIDGGLSELVLSTGQFTTYNEKNGLMNNQICKIVEGNDNTLWLSTLNGISNLDLRTRGITNYNKESGIRVQEFSPCAGLHLSGNRIFFAGNNGFTLFNPNDIITNPNVPPIILDKLHINNCLIQAGDEGDILKENISTQKKIVLKYNQTNITIEYCALNYIFNNKNQYAYKLEGFDHDWNEVGNRRTAYYTNIPSGTYKFVVKGSNNDGIWNEEGTTLEIVVLPPLWKTWWAYLFYAVVAIALIAFIIRYFTEKKRLQNNIRLKQMEAEVHEEYYQERNRLFTNFSHELRTPLTLIMAPLEEFVKRTDLTDDIHYKVKLMLRNAQRLLRIVNNLMDLQKNESGTMKLQVSENDMIKFTHEAVSSFQDLALYRNIHLKFKHSIDCQPVWFDWNLLEKVYFNFLSNAFKNVPDGGTVSVELDVKPYSELTFFLPAKLNKYKNTEIRYLTISIQDNGVGIAPDELEKIFQPFYQVAQNEHSKSGTGIGLSLSKAIIEMHHGVVWAENATGANMSGVGLSSSGAVFKFVLPVDKSLFAPEMIIESAEDKAVSFSVELPDAAYEPDNSSRKQATILVVEDNRDLNNYICSCLADRYNVVGVTNGEDALAKAVYLLPNLIITDLMMPKMNGIELIRRLKKDMNTSHIPIIMVTAKTGTDDIKEGYAAGADEYITKPFDASILKIRVDNLIQSREKLKELYSKNFSLESLGVDVTSVDEKFMQKLYATLQQNIANSDLNLDAFCKELGLSKSNLYRKIKQITGYSPNEFIRNFRLETAAKMLKETDMSITEVYCAVGYNSLAYFSNSFKTLYGVSPSEFKNRSEGERE